MSSLKLPARTVRFLSQLRPLAQKRVSPSHSDPSPLNPQPAPTNPRVKANAELLQKYYTPELLQSIQIAESVVNPRQLWRLQTSGDRFRAMVPPSNPNSDYSTTDPKWDEPVVFPNQAPGKAPYPPIPDRHASDERGLSLRFITDTKTRDRRSGTPLRKEVAEGLARLTGLDLQYISNLYVRPIVMKRVSLKTSKGNIPNFFVMTVVGDRRGTIGLGIGKSRDGIRVAAVKAHWNAVKNLTAIPRYDERTIVGDIEYKYHAVKLFMRSAPAGFGLRVNPNIFEVCQAAGIKDLRGKIYRSRNPVLVVKGFIEALTKQQLIPELAAGRGKKIVDLRRVYYSA